MLIYTPNNAAGIPLFTRPCLPTGNGTVNGVTSWPPFLTYPQLERSLIPVPKVLSSIPSFPGAQVPHRTMEKVVPISKGAKDMLNKYPKVVYRKRTQSHGGGAQLHHALPRISPLLTIGFTCIPNKNIFIAKPTLFDDGPVLPRAVKQVRMNHPVRFQNRPVSFSGLYKSRIAGFDFESACN